MINLEFVQLHKENDDLFKKAKSVWIPFIMEVNANDGTVECNDEIISGLKKRVAIQGNRPDMHFEIAVINDEVIGIAMFAIDLGTIYGLLDSPGYGTIMGFYIKPEYRRKGYGRQFYEHIQKVLQKDGATKIYLCPDSVTGVPFWQAIGFADSEKTDPDDKKPIYIKTIENSKDVSSQKDIITIAIDKYLTNELAVKIAKAQWNTDKPKWVNSIRERIYCDDYFYDCFNVLALNRNDDVIGRLYCIQNENEKSLWYFGDLSIIPSYRRIGVASRMIKAAVKHLSEINAKILRCFVEPDNSSSIALQKSLGFHEKPYEKFNDLINDGQLMFEIEIPSSYSIIPATENEARFITWFYNQNIDALHGSEISHDEWRTMLASANPDEQNFLVFRGCVPVAWLKINGLQNRDIAWISMIVVSSKHQQQGIGKYAVDFAEEYICSKGFSKVGIHTTTDNIPAQNLYKNCGYIITSCREIVCGDGIKRKEITLEKTQNKLEFVN